MGLLQQGQWVDQWYDTHSNQGAFKRTTAQFRSWITQDGAAGPTGKAGFNAEADRYRLYVSMACPWAHRALIFRQLKDLQDLIDVVCVDALMLDNGWELPQNDDGLNFLYELYLKAAPDYEGRVTVPVLWDKQTQTIVSNESADIIRMLNGAFDALTGNTEDFYPAPLRAQIDTINERIYHSINNGVYKAGFATSQEAYETAFYELFDALEWIENILSRQRYLTGDRLTEADWRLFTTLIRFDAVYFGHFKTNLKRIADYPALGNYLRELYQIPGIAETVDIEHIKRHYYGSHKTVNPTGIIPLGPEPDFSRPHNRHSL